jgi:NAD(P)H-hydrate repair Nnr-like enzyme with NAD(P)H-hydrate dehydratase domain
MTQRAFLYGDLRRRHHNPGSSDALTVGGLVAAVGASVVATLLAAKAGTDLAGTLVGATCAPVVSRYDLKLWIGHLFEGAAYLPS